MCEVEYKVVYKPKGGRVRQVVRVTCVNSACGNLIPGGDGWSVYKTFPSHGDVIYERFVPKDDDGEWRKIYMEGDEE